MIKTIVCLYIYLHAKIFYLVLFRNQIIITVYNFHLCNVVQSKIMIYGHWLLVSFSMLAIKSEIAVNQTSRSIHLNFNLITKTNFWWCFPHNLQNYPGISYVFVEKTASMWKLDIFLNYIHLHNAMLYALWFSSWQKNMP